MEALQFLGQKKSYLGLMQPDKIWYQFSAAASLEFDSLNLGNSNNCFHSAKVCEAPSRVVIAEIEEEIGTKKSRVESQRKTPEEEGGLLGWLEIVRERVQLAATIWREWQDLVHRSRRGNPSPVAKIWSSRIQGFC
jgi:hypothetical protein